MRRLPKWNQPTRPPDEDQATTPSPHLTLNIIYEVPCNDCPPIYNGQPYPWLKVKLDILMSNEGKCAWELTFWE